MSHVSLGFSTVAQFGPRQGHFEHSLELPQILAEPLSCGPQCLWGGLAFVQAELQEE